MLIILFLALLANLSCYAPESSSLTLEIAKNSYRRGYIQAGLDFEVCSDSSVTWHDLRSAADLKAEDWRYKLTGEDEK